MDSTKGYIHVYTGNGKGKTTAAFGLAVRALCAGKSVYIGQFVKSMRYNETKIGQLFDQVRSSSWVGDVLSARIPKRSISGWHATV